MVGCFERIMPLSVIGKVPRDGMISPPGIIPESIITTSPVFIHSQFTQRGFGWLERRNWWIVVESRDRWIFVKKRRGKRNLFSCSCQKKSTFIMLFPLLVFTAATSTFYYYQQFSFNFNWFLLHKKVPGDTNYWQYLALFLSTGKLTVLDKDSFQSRFEPNYWHICEYMRQIWGHYWQIFKHA